MTTANATKGIDAHIVAAATTPNGLAFYDVNDVSQINTDEFYNGLKKETLRHIQTMNVLFHQLYDMFKNEIDFQLKLVDNLWVNTVRMNEAQQKRRSSTSKYNRLSEEEEKLMYLTNHEIKQLQESNATLMESTKPLYQSIKILDSYISRLAIGPGANFIAEHKSNKPLGYFAESLINFYQYFSKCIRRMNYRTNEYKFNDEDTIKDYRNLIQPSEETEELLLAGLEPCKNIDPDSVDI